MQVAMNNLEALGGAPEFDLLVVGAGGAGLSAALFAAVAGARVLVVERTEFVGGTTAWSAGTTWVPLSHHAATVNAADNRQAVETYLDHAVGGNAPAALRKAFLDHGARAIEAVERHTEVRFRPYPKHPDYISDLPGSTLNGRALEPLPFDGRLLGEHFALLRPPIPEFTVLGGMMVDRTDINHLLGMTQSWASLRHSVRILARHLWDRMRYPRGTRLVMGNALVGRLLYSLSRHAKVTLAMKTTVTSLGEPTATGRTVTLVQNGVERTVRVKSGVVLASGGFNRDPQERARLLPGVPAEWSPAAPGHTGQAHSLARGLGAHYYEGGKSHAFWAPVSIRKRADGSTAVFPHFVMDRAKPGMLTVNHRGERFVNESTSYHLFGIAMQAAHQTTPTVPAWLVCDAQALRKYGMGMVRPGGKGLEPYLADGYLLQGASLQELAQQTGTDAATLASTVATFNAYAEAGFDPDFQRGVTAYQQNLGDPAWSGKNPNLGPLVEAPFYAMRLYPGDIGASTGLTTDEFARVLGRDGQAIAGLYAVGNDMQSIMGGTYPAPGITIGPGLVFAYIAAQHALQAG